jgi:large subunit ribosomal protein L15
MRLHNLPKSTGSGPSRKRVGRGRGSGHGKTSGRGHNGQKSRSGYSARPGFESGHIPLFRRLPKRGFSNFRFRTVYAVVNVGDLDGIENAEVIDREALVNAGLVRKNAGKIKILGNGEVTKALKVKVDKFSGQAAEKIKSAGGEAIGTDIKKDVTEQDPDAS